MKVEIKNLIGIKNLSINTGKAALICGQNGSGKSSVAAAIRMALLGEIERIDYKKQAPELAHHGAKDYGVKIMLGEREFSFGKEFGNKHMTPHENPFYLGIVTGSKLPAELDEEMMKSMIIHLAGISLTADEIRKRLSAYDQEKVALLIPEITKSWDAAEAYAKTQATGSRAVWKSITGEVYGENKAETWTAVKPETNPARLDELSAEIVMLETQIKQLVEQEAEAKAKNNVLENQLKNLESKRAESAKIEELKSLLAGAEKALAEHKVEIAKCEELASGTPEPAKYQCPCCQGALMFSSGELEPWSHEGKAPDLEAKSTLKRLIESLDIRESQVARRKKELEQAVAAKAIADEIERESEGKTLINLADVNALLQEKRNTYSAYVKEHNMLTKAAEQSEVADDKTANAARHHAGVKEWDVLQKEVSASGIRQKLLTTALDSFNESLGNLKTGNMPVVRIASSMVPMLSDRPYYLLSESEKWRVNTLMTLAISILSGIKIAIIDRFDLLGIPDRPAFLKLFADIANRGDIDHIIVAGTLKEPPKLPTPYSVFWLEDGVVGLVSNDKLAA